MRFVTFIKEMEDQPDDEYLQAFLDWFRKQEKLHLSSDPRILGIAYSHRLDEKQTRGFQIAFMMYFFEEKNQLPRDIKTDKKAFLDAINAIVYIQQREGNHSSQEIMYFDGGID